MMKKLFKTVLILLLSIFALLSAVACDRAGESEGTTLPDGQLDPVWDAAIYTEDTALGSGAKTVRVDIEAKGYTLILTVKTDAANLGEALYALDVINDPGFFDTVNGMKADWGADQAYWAFYQGEDLMPYGVGDAQISGGEHFRLVYTQQ